MSDELGVMPVNPFSSDQGEGYCLSGAPDTRAVIRSHKPLGYDCALEAAGLAMDPSVRALPVIRLTRHPRTGMRLGDRADADQKGGALTI